MVLSRRHAIPFAAALLSAASLLRAEDATETLPKPKLTGPITDAKEKEAALKKYGGTKETEAAVELGLGWLARHAEAGGGWKADTYNTHCAEGGKKCEGIGGGHHGEKVPHSYNDAQTGFCVMAFLGHGVLPNEEGTEQEKLVFNSLKKLEAPHSAWGIAVACEALSTAEALERKGRWKAAAHRLADRLIGMRLEDGCWAYAGDFRGGSDTPYTAFCVQALVAARDAGFELPADLAKRTDDFLNSLEEAKGGKLAYLKNGRQYGYTPTKVNGHSGAAIRELLAVGTGGDRHKLHLMCVGNDIPAWKIEWQTVPGYKEKFQVGNLDLYRWYYGTIATFHAGGSHWTNYFGAVKRELLAHQRKSDKDGCAKGSWNNEGTYEIDVGGRVFTTALAILMLEQPYRQVRQRK
ncbi:MAG: hypothetical protein FD180_1146 [Planctomycetota bacterium]|nr:MAG: hypothetical protein FD180_1146 [Planctomycetota bacterium]